VAVAARNLPTGARLEGKDVKLVAWPSSSAVSNGFSNPEAVINRGLIASMVENEPFTGSKLAPLEAGAGLPPTIPSGMRAMSVKVDEVIGVAGFAVPGARVDVVVTMRRGGSRDESMSRTVVSNVLVLTAGTRYDQEQAKDGKPQPSTVVTLAVLPEDAERIALAATEGKISLALRNPLDVAPTTTRGIRTTALMNGEGGGPALVPRRVSVPARRDAMSREIAAPATQKIYKIEAIRATKRTEEVVQ
jgi:pilus assembly protein CpaB